MCPACAPAARAKAQSHYDIGEILSAVTRDPDWVSKVIVGAACFLGGFLIVPLFVFFGYRLRVIRAQRKRPDAPELPSFDDLGELIADGFKIWLAELLPVLALTLGAGVPIGAGVYLLASSPTPPRGGPAYLAVGLLVLGGGVYLLGALVYTYFLPAIEMEYLDSGRVSAGLRLGPLWRRVWGAPVDYLIFFLFHYLIQQVLAPLGVFLCFVGLYATLPWAWLTDAVLFGRYLAARDEEAARAEAAARNEGTGPGEGEAGGAASADFPETGSR